MQTKKLRQAFLDYFKNNRHEVVSSSSLVPANDPTLLFTNAGMVQFKDTFLGKEKCNYKRATSCQRCLRVSGKHNDLEEVGHTARHHTFFEMLGNFSFGDYFKREAIHYAWNFLTKDLEIPAKRLWVTVYEDDDEAADIWLKDLKVDSNRFARCGAKDNFWAMADTGPCGPSTEIFYDHGDKVAGGPPGSNEAEGDRYVEVWNNVFMQYTRDANGKMKPLPKPSVDTGMGLERIAAVMQGVHDNYDTDLFQHLIKFEAELAKVKDLKNPSLRVIADHIRACAFLVADGIVPSNEGRGYVLRRIIRRALRHGNQLGLKEPFLYKLVSPLADEMSKAYPILSDSQKIIEKVLEQEEQQFAITLEQGLKIFNQEVKKLRTKKIPGKTVFKLYDTYGFPLDLTRDISREQGLDIDQGSFDKELAKQRKQSQQASKFGEAVPVDAANNPLSKQAIRSTEFTGYDELITTAKVVALQNKNGELIKQFKTGDIGIVVLNRTPFYAEAGGQVGDSGELLFADNGKFIVNNTQKLGDVYLHYGNLKAGKLSLKSKVTALVDAVRRRAIMSNHSATHLLHAALRQVLGKHVAQKGSLVDGERLRFDFTHYQPLTKAELAKVEQLVNQQIVANQVVATKSMSTKAAMKQGAMALFGEKYADKVRVVSMGDFSKELCGGTHVERSGTIGLLKIIAETGIAAGVRRIEALTGTAALAWLNDLANNIEKMARLLKTSPQQLMAKLQQLLQQNSKQEKQLQRLKQSMASSAARDIASSAVQVGDVQVIAVELADADNQALLSSIDELKQRWSKTVVVLAAKNAGKVQLVVGVSKQCGKELHAGELLNYIAAQIGGKGGGRADLARGGGTKPELLDQALASVVPWLEGKLAAKFK